jgi:hypothetical protein
VQVAHYLGLLHRAEVNLAGAFREVAEGHRDEVDLFHTCRQLAQECDRHAEQLWPFAERYGEDAPEEPDRLHAEIFGGTRSGGLGLLRDLHDLYVMAALCEMAWTVIGQAAQGLRDDELLEVVTRSERQTVTQLAWVRTRIEQAAPQALVVS